MPLFVKTGNKQSVKGSVSHTGFQSHGCWAIETSPTESRIYFARNFLNFFLADFFFGGKCVSLFEMAEAFPPQHGQMSGNPVRFRDGCATVTATSSKSTAARREGGMRFEAEVRIPV